MSSCSRSRDWQAFCQVANFRDRDVKHIFSAALKIRFQPGVYRENGRILVALLIFLFA